jgi:hypothetical protein
MIGISFLASAASQHCPPGSRLNIPAESFSYDFTFITSWLLWFGSFYSPSLQFIRSLGPIYGLNRILFIFFSCLSEVRSFFGPSDSSLASGPAQYSSRIFFIDSPSGIRCMIRIFSLVPPAFAWDRLRIPAEFPSFGFSFFILRYIAFALCLLYLNV